MGGMMKPGLAIVLVLILAVAAGCGSGDSSATVDNATPRPYPWLKGPSREFLVPGGDNIVQTFGEEGTAKERQQASEVITLWMKARAARSWGKDCTYFSKAFKHALVATDAHRVTGGRVDTCPEALEYFGRLASGNYKNNLAGPIDSLRVGEGQKVDGSFGKMAFAQYHGSDGKDWIIPLEPEGGSWRIAKAAPINRLR